MLHNLVESTRLCMHSRLLGVLLYAKTKAVWRDRGRGLWHHYGGPKHSWAHQTPCPLRYLLCFHSSHCFQFNKPSTKAKRIIYLHSTRRPIPLSQTHCVCFCMHTLCYKSILSVLFERRAKTFLFAATSFPMHLLEVRMFPYIPITSAHIKNPVLILFSVLILKRINH